MAGTLRTMSAYLSAREAADYCGVSEKTIRNWIASGRLSAERSACAFRIAQEDLATLRRETLRTPQEEGAESASAEATEDVRAEGPRTEVAAGIVELVALLRDREAKIDDLSTRLVGYAEAAAMWQARAAVFAHQLESAHAELRALRAPEQPTMPGPEPVPGPFPEPDPPGPSFAPRWGRWSAIVLALAGALALVAGTAPAWHPW